MREDIRRIVAFLCALCLIISGEGRLSLTALADVIHPAFSAYAAAAAGTEHDSVRAADAADDARTDDDAVAYAAADTGHDEDSAAETVLSENVLTMEWDIYRVKVRYGKEAGIPDDARLVVRELTDSNDPDYSDYIAAGADTAGVGADSVGVAKAFDISVRSDETGEEYQPSSDMKVEISIPSYYIRDDMQIDVVHFAEKQAEAYSPVLMDVRLSDNTAAFNTDGFSVFVLLGYTVDFHWGEYTYNLQGGSKIYLSELLKILAQGGDGGSSDEEAERLLALAADMSQVSSVAFSNPELLKIEKQSSEQAENDWLLTSLAAFDTEEKLTIALTGGEKIIIRVTDAAPDSYKYYVEISNGTNGRSFDTLVEAVDYANSSNYQYNLYIGENCTLNSTVTFTRGYNLTIYGNGHTLTRGGGFTGDLLSRTVNNAWKIENLTINNGDVAATGNTIVKGGTGELKLTNVKINGGSATGSLISDAGTGVLTIENGSELNGPTVSTSSALIMKSANGAVNITDSTVNGASNTAALIRNVGSGTMTITDSAINRNQSTGIGIESTGSGALTFKQCNINGSNNENATGSLIKMGTGVLTLTDTTVTGHTVSAAGVPAVDASSVTTANGVKLSGAVKINGNTSGGRPANLKVSGNNHLHISADLSGNIGISDSDKAHVGDIFGTRYNTSTTVSGKISNDLSDTVMLAYPNGTSLKWLALDTSAFDPHVSNAIAKITDEDGKILLNLTSTGYSYAVYNTFDNALNARSNHFYQYSEESGFTVYSGPVNIEFLVDQIEIGAQKTLNKANENITFKSASADDTDPYPYRGRNEKTRLLFTNGSNGGAGGGQNRFIFQGNDSVYSFENIIVDGNREESQEGGLIKVGNRGGVSYNASVYLKDGAVITGGRTNHDDQGGGIYVGRGCRLYMEPGSLIEDCYSVHSGASSGGAVYLAEGEFYCDGGTIKDCQSLGGAAVDCGGPTDHSRSDKARIYLSGTPHIYDNTDINGQKMNVHLNYDSNEIIQVIGDMTEEAKVAISVNEDSTIFERHGKEGKPFGTIAPGVTVNPYSFINDRDTALSAIRSEDHPNLLVWSYLLIVDVIEDYYIDGSLARSTKLAEGKDFLDTAFYGSAESGTAAGLAEKSLENFRIDLNKISTLEKVSVRSHKAIDGVTYPAVDKVTNVRFVRHGDAGGRRWEISSDNGATWAPLMGRRVEIHYRRECRDNVRFYYVISDTKAIPYATFKLERSYPGNSSYSLYTLGSGKGKTTDDGKEVKDISEGGIYTTDQDGSFIMNLPEGYYRLTETTERDGHEILTQPVTFKVTVNDVKDTEDNEQVSPYAVKDPQNAIWILNDYSTWKTEKYIGTLKTENPNGKIPVYIARVCRWDAAKTSEQQAWLYFEYLINTGKDKKGNYKGAFNYAANISSGKVVIETLRKGLQDDGSDDTKFDGEARGRYTLTGGTTFNNNLDVTLRTAEVVDGTSVITRGYNGGSLFTNNGALTLENIILDGGFNRSTGSGYACGTEGGLVYTSGALTVNSGVTLRNSKAVRGGAIAAKNTSASVTFTGTPSAKPQISSCVADNAGGGLYISERAVLDISFAEISDCYADASMAVPGGQTQTGSASGGGAIYLGSNTVAEENGLVIDGHSDHDIEAHTDDWNKSEAEAAAANAVNGGGIYISAGASFTFSGGEIIKCKASANGGAIYNAGRLIMAEKDEADSHELINGSIEYCSAISTDSAKGNGGAIYNAAGGTVDMTGGYLEHCIASGNGGGIYTESTATQTVAEKTVGAVNMHTEGDKPGVISDCEAANGGGVYVKAGGLDMTGGEIRNCKAFAPKNSNGEVIVRIDSNTFETICVSGKGGGVYNLGNVILATAADYPGKIDSCSADFAGGGIYTTGTGSMSIIGGEMDDNRAGYYGGAIYDDTIREESPTADLTIKGVVIRGHVNLDEDIANARNGGAIYAANGNLELIDNGSGDSAVHVQIYDCTASEQGGAIYHIYNQHKHKNIAGGRKTSLTMINAIIDGHDQLADETPNADYGGAIYVFNGCNESLPGHEGHNRVDHDPPKFSQYQGPKIIISGGKIADCTADINGGAIYCDSPVQGKGTNTISIQDGAVINGHESLAAEVWNANGNDTTSNANQTNLGGGAIYFKRGTLRVGRNGDTSRTKIINCTAKHYGGAIFGLPMGTNIDEEGESYTAKLENCLIDGHRSDSGTMAAAPEQANAGLGGGAVCMKMSTVTIENSKLKNLRAPYGAAILGRTNDAGTQAAKITIDGSRIEYNIATADYGGAINALSGEAIGDAGIKPVSGNEVCRFYLERDSVIYNNFGIGALASQQKNLVLTRHKSEVNGEVGETNAIINTTANGLSENAHIGIYVTGDDGMEGSPESEPYELHGGYEDDFGTYYNNAAGKANLYKLINDRNGMYGAVCTLTYGNHTTNKGHNKSNYIIRWQSYLCKLTDGSGNLLFITKPGGWAGTRVVDEITYYPAVFMTLKEAFNAMKGFDADGTTELKLYKADASEYKTDKDIQLHMLRNYEQPGSDRPTFDANRKATFTTANKQASLNVGYKIGDVYVYSKGSFTGADDNRATIMRGENGDSMLTLGMGTVDSRTMTLTKLILDGGSRKGLRFSQEGGIVRSVGGTLNITSGAVLQYSEAQNWERGGAVYAENCNLNIDGDARIRYCTSGHGGGIHIGDAYTTAIIEGSTVIEHCTAKGWGGGVFCHSGNTTVRGTTNISYCEAKGGNGGGLNVGWGAKATLAGNVEIDHCSALSGGGLNVETNEYGVNTLDFTGGKISNNTAVNSGGGMYVGEGSRISMTGGEISQNQAPLGGGIETGDGGVFVMNSGKFSGNVSSNKGGAVYLNSGADMTMTGGVIEKNKVTAGGEGAGIYVAEGGKLKLSEAPGFGSGSDANTAAIDGYSTKENGGEAYGSNDVRQDIFLKGYLGQKNGNPIPATSVVVTGAFADTVAEGSIYVWAEKPAGDEEDNHYEQLKQFAVFDAALVRDDEKLTLTDKQTARVYKAFRNAQDDETTNNGTGEWLSGSEGDEPGYIYWSGISGKRKVILRKVNSGFESLAGAHFNVYKGNSSRVFVLKDKAAGTRETLGKYTDEHGVEIDPLVSLNSGIFWIGVLPYGTYYLNETAAPTAAAYRANKNKWFCLIVDEKGVWMSQSGYNASDKTEAQNKASALADVTAVRTAAVGS